MDKLIELRSRIKRKKPDFLQDGSNLVKRIRNNCRWRRPTGSQSKVRLGRKGQPLKRKSGYSSPKMVRGLLKNGLLPVLVNTPADLESLNKETHACVIASGVGEKKRLAIIEAANRKGVFIFNYKDIKEAVKKLEQKFVERKKKPKKSDAVQSKKTTAKKETPKTDEKPSSTTEKGAEKSETSNEKKEWDKLLTQKK